MEWNGQPAENKGIGNSQGVYSWQIKPLINKKIACRNKGLGEQLRF